MTTNKCPVYKKCGGCQLQNLTYEEQKSFKMVKVIKLLGKFCHVNEIIGMEHPYNYRNKVQAAFGTDKNGKTVCGVYQSSTHRIVENSNCFIQDETANKIIATIKMLLKSFKLKPFNEVTMTGYLRHVLIKRGFKSGEVMVVLVTGYENFPERRSFINAIIKRCPEVTTIVENINNKHGNLILGEKNIVLYGNGKITEELLGYKFEISPSSFYQVNPTMTEVLYTKAISFLNLSGKETVIDAYCGTGTIGIIASKEAGQVIGVELNSDAVADAENNRRLNGIENITFICDDASDFLSRAAKDKRRVDAVIMDPPRTGSDKRFLSALSLLAPKKVVYISCNPETQARDITFLRSKGYTVKKLQPVDMFPFTNHIECIALLEHR